MHVTFYICHCGLVAAAVRGVHMLLHAEVQEHAAGVRTTLRDEHAASVAFTLLLWRHVLSPLQAGFLLVQVQSGPLSLPEKHALSGCRSACARMMVCLCRWQGGPIRKHFVGLESNEAECCAGGAAEFLVVRGWEG